MVFETALLCMALNLYHEARDQPLVGQLAVGSVVINRVRDPRFPNDVCEVVFEGPIDDNNNPKRHRCQFSWYCDGKNDEPLNKVAWHNSKNIAAYLLTGKPIDVTEGALFYHADFVSPNWKNYKPVVQIQNHIFYTIKGE